MKHNHLFLMLVILTNMVVCSMTLVSCSDDDPVKKEQKDGDKDMQPDKDPEKNTTDVAVTGPVIEYGALYADIKGVVNLDVISASYSNVAVGVEISTTSDFANKKRVQSSEVVGRKISAHFSLTPSTRFYYRTYVSVSTLSYDYYGETYSFTTKSINKDAAVTGVVSEIGAFSVKISGSTNLQHFKAASIEPSVGIEVSEKEDFSNACKVSATGDIEKFNVGVTSLASNKKYYYRTYLRVTNLYYSEKEFYMYGNIQSFTTKPINDDFVVTGDVTNIGLFNATLGGSTNLKYFEAAGIKTSVGMEISIKDNFSNSRKVTVTGNVEKFNVEVSSLIPETKYYYRTYLKANINSQECYYYGDTQSFTTKSVNKDAVVTGDASDIGIFSARISGSTNLKQFETAGIKTSVGIEVSEKDDFSNARRLPVTGNVEKFNVEVSSLSSGNKYYYRTYFKANINSQECYYYGEKKSFTTKGLDNSNHYVDLGLPSGALWATINIGATSPEDYGDYFAWGETEGYYSGKTTFKWSTYKWCKGSETTMTKYCTWSKFGYNGFTDNKTELEPEDDAAYVNWGSGWRMPTYDQLKELRDQCTWTWYTINKVEGYLVAGKNGNVIFLPAAGYRGDASLYHAGSHGNYWSRTLYSDNPCTAWYRYFYSSNVGMHGLGRYYGRSVRPVRVSQ